MASRSSCAQLEISTGRRGCHDRKYCETFIQCVEDNAAYKPEVKLGWSRHHPSLAPNETPGGVYVRQDRRMPFHTPRIIFIEQSKTAWAKGAHVPQRRRVESGDGGYVFARVPDRRSALAAPSSEHSCPAHGSGSHADTRPLSAFLLEPRRQACFPSQRLFKTTCNYRN